MKQTTNDWLIVAEDDLLSAKALSTDERLTHVASFHCQQCIEKCLKAVIEEPNKPSIKSHDLIRLLLTINISLSENEMMLLSIINEVYIDSRYPGDLGLLPHGKPTKSEIEVFVQFCETIFYRIKDQLAQLPSVN